MMNKYFLLILCFLISSNYLSGEKIEIPLGTSTILILQREKFDPQKHKIEYREGTCDVINLIDGWLVFGTDATMPKYKLTSASLIMENVNIPLEIKGMFDPWIDKEPSQANFKLSKLSNEYIKLVGSFSLGAGYYEVEWHIVNGVSYRPSIIGKI